MDHDVDLLVPDIVEPARLDDLQALVGEGRGVDRDLGAHAPGRVAERLLRRDRGEVPRPAGRGTAHRTRSGSADPRAPGCSPARLCQIAECSESIGRSQPSGLASGSAGSTGASRRRRSARASGITRWPPATSVSLFAVATILPARAPRGPAAGSRRRPCRRRPGRRRRASRARPGRRRRAVIAMPAGRLAASAAAPPPSPSATIAGRCRRACSARRVAFRPAASATTRNGGSPSRTSSAWRPIEPVEPRQRDAARAAPAGVSGGR